MKQTYLKYSIIQKIRYIISIYKKRGQLRRGEIPEEDYDRWVKLVRRYSSLHGRTIDFVSRKGGKLND